MDRVGLRVFDWSFLWHVFDFWTISRLEPNHKSSVTSRPVEAPGRRSHHGGGEWTPVRSFVVLVHSFHETRVYWKEVLRTELGHERSQTGWDEAPPHIRRRTGHSQARRAEKSVPKCVRRCFDSMPSKLQVSQNAQERFGA